MHWGHLEEGETIIECAIRETIEETGHKCHLLCDKEIAKIEYVSSRGENVENYFFIAIDDGVSIEYINEKDKEKTVWINYLAVEDKLIYPNLIEFWKSIKSFVKRVIEGE